MGRWSKRPAVRGAGASASAKPLSQQEQNEGRWFERPTVRGAGATACAKLHAGQGQTVGRWSERPTAVVEAVPEARSVAQRLATRSGARVFATAITGPNSAASSEFRVAPHAAQEAEIHVQAPDVAFSLQKPRGRKQNSPAWSASAEAAVT